MSKEAMKLRTAAEKVVELCSERPLSLGKWFIDMSEACESLREALAEQPAQDVPEVGFGNTALDKMAENAKELGLDYEPAQPRAWFTIDELNAWADKKLKENPQWAEQPAQQEPVAYWIPKAKQFCLPSSDGTRPFAKAWEPLYTSPPAQRTWVGLTDEEIARVVSLAGFAPDWVEAHIAIQIVRVLEAKLRSKNT